jgi:choline dehydrogenase-like flavoprotein
MSEPILNYDVVIIGSGAGGGTVAKELASLCGKGLKVALLEWGGRFEKKDNTREELAMADKYYFGHGGVQNAEQDMTFAFAKAVGGTTNVYTGTSIVPGDEVFARWGVPGIDLKDLKPRYDKFIRENNVHLNTPEEINDNNKLFYEGCRKLGWKVEQFPVNTRGCVGLATCNLGCAIHAKQGTAAVQIPMAESQGVEVIPFCRAERIEDHDVLADVIPPEHGFAASRLTPGRYRFRAKKIVVSAGVMNSAPLLMRSYGSDFSPAIGRYFTCHPALILVAEQPHPIRVTSGHPKSFYCDEFHESRRFLLETCFYFPFTLAKNLCGYGAEMDELISHYQRLQMILVLAIDKPEAHNRIGPAKLSEFKVHYRFHEDTIQSFVHAIRASAKIFFAAGATRVHAPASGRFFIDAKDADAIDRLITRDKFKLGQISISAAHLMGGCRMGEDPRVAVTDSWGRVHGKPDVYVADASLFPAASEVNPYLTIMALSDRVAEAVRNDLDSTLLT